MSTNTITATPAPTQLAAIKRELGFIGRGAQRIEGSSSEDFESVDAIAQAVQIALTALFEYELSQQPMMDDDLSAADLILKAGAPVQEEVTSHA